MITGQRNELLLVSVKWSSWLTKEGGHCSGLWSSVSHATSVDPQFKCDLHCRARETGKSRSGGCSGRSIDERNSRVEHAFKEQGYNLRFNWHIDGMVMGGAVVPGDISTPGMVTTILVKKHCVWRHGEVKNAYRFPWDNMTPDVKIF